MTLLRSKMRLRGASSSLTSYDPPIIVPGPGRITLSGKTILASDGITPLHLRGVNFGAWGRELDTDPALYRSWGANFVRLVMPRWWGFYEWLADIDARDSASANGYIKPSHFTIIASMMALLKAAGFIVQLEFDSDCGANGTQSQTEADYCRAAIGLAPGAGLYSNFWTNPEQIAFVVAAWQYLLTNLPDKPDIIGCLAEPVSNGPAIKAFYQTVMDGCLAIDPQAIFAIGGNFYGSGAMQDVYFSDRTNIIYVCNLLGGVLTDLPKLSEKLADIVTFRNTNNVPVEVDQMGSRVDEDPARNYSNAGHSMCNANGIHWATWQNRAWSLDEGKYAFFYNPDSWTLRTLNRDRFIIYCAQTYAALETSAQAAATAESGVLFYVKDFSTVFQNSAGTTPVTATGQPMGLINPVVGSGLTLVQATNGARPTITTLAGTGRLAMLFDAMNTYLAGSVAYFSSGSQMTVIAAGIPADVGAVQDFVSAGGSGGNPKWPRLGSSAAKLANCVWQSDTTTNTITGTITTGGPGGGAPIVMSCTRDGSGNKILYSNGLQDGATNSTADGTIASFSRLRVGGGTSNAPTFNGPIGVLCFAHTAMSAANREAIERFAAYHVGAYYLV